MLLRLIFFIEQLERFVKNYMNDITNGRRKELILEIEQLKERIDKIEKEME